MEKKDLSHFKYYVKRLKEMGFEYMDYTLLVLHDDLYPEKRWYKAIDDCLFYIDIVDCAVYSSYAIYNKKNFPHMSLRCFPHYDAISIARHYKIGVDKDFQEEIKPFYGEQHETINEYPTWRAAFNQLVADYHDLETNTQRGNFFIS